MINGQSGDLFIIESPKTCKRELVKAWADWAETFGFNPRDVPLGAYFIFDRSTLSVRAECVVRDHDGFVVSAVGRPVHQWVEKRIPWPPPLPPPYD